MKKFLILLMCLVFVNPVLGLEVSNLAFYRNGEEIGYVSYHPVPVNIHFDVLGENLSTIFVDLSEINPAYGNTFVRLSQCEYNDSVYSCIVRDKTLLLSDGTVELSFSFTDTDSTEFSNSLFYTFSIDNTKPRVSWMGTEHCLDDECYIASNKMTKIIITLEDSVGSFDKKMIFYDLNGRKHFASNCTGMECSDNTRTTCNSGDSVKLMLTYYQSVPSQDDAGNPVEGGMTSTWLTCDSEAPEFVNLTVVSNSDYGQIQEGDTLTITVNVTEDLGKVKGSVNLSDLNGGGVTTVDCREWEGVHSCEWNVPNINTGTAELEFLFVDTAGNELTGVKKETIVLPLHEGRTADCFRITTDPVVPRKMDRIMLQLALDNDIPFYSYGRFTLNQKSCNQPKIYHQEITNCMYAYEEDGKTNVTSWLPFELSIADETLDYGKKNRINFVYPSDLEVNDLHSTFQMVCNLSFVVADSTGIYENPEMETVMYEFEYRNSALGDPGSAIVGKIRTYEDNSLVQQSWIGWVDNGLSTLSDICSIGSTLNYIESFGTTMELTGTALKNIPALGAIGVGMFALGHGIYVPFEYINKILNFGPSAEIPGSGLFGRDPKDIVLSIMGVSCAFTSCVIDDQIKESGDEDTWWRKDIPGDFAVSHLTDNINNPNPKNSIIAALYTKCWPAVFYHLNKYRENNCEVLSCLKDQTRFTVSVESCEQAKGYYVCSQFLGEVFEAPFIRQFKNLADNLNNYVDKLLPNLLMDAWNLGCKTTGGDTATSGAAVAFCHVPKSLGRLMAQDSLTSGSQVFMYPSDEDVCAAALCNEENYADCPRPSSSLVKQFWSGFAQIPPPTADEMQAFRETIREQRRQMAIDDPRTALDVRRSVARFLFTYDCLSQPNTNKDCAKERRYLKSTYDIDVDKYMTLGEASKDGKSIILNREITVGDKTFKKGQEIKIDSKDLTAIKHQVSMDLSNELSQQQERQESLEERREAARKRGLTLEEYDLEQMDLLVKDLELFAPGSEMYELTTGKGAASDRAGMTISDYENAKTKLKEDYGWTDDMFPPFEIPEPPETPTDYKQWEKQYGAYMADYKDEETGEYNYEQYKQEYDQQKTAYDDAGKTKADDHKTEIKRRSDEVHRESIKRRTDQFVKLIYETFLRRFLSVRENPAIREFSIKGWDVGEAWANAADWTNQYFNSEAWKNGFCNPNTDLGSAEDEGTVYECRGFGAHCEPVLSWGGQRIVYNETNGEPDHYLYSLIYFLGHANEDVKYEIILKYDLGETQALPRTDLPKGATHQESYGFTSTKYYTKMCVKFNMVLPRNNPRAKKEYCRDIIEDRYYTGEPVYYNAAEGSPEPEPEGWNPGL